MAEPGNLLFDFRNPRSPDESFADEAAVLGYLVENADVDELVKSILSAGWMDYEPLIVQMPGNIVLEGNRRLAALRLIADSGLSLTLAISGWVAGGFGEAVEERAWDCCHVLGLRGR